MKLTARETVLCLRVLDQMRGANPRIVPRSPREFDLTIKVEHGDKGMSCFWLPNKALRLLVSSAGADDVWTEFNRRVVPQLRRA